MLIIYRTQLGYLPAPFTGLRAVESKGGAIKFVVYTLASQSDGSAYNPAIVEDPLSSAKLYDNIFIRHWDFYVESTLR